jgi:hypothetical protein
MESRYASRSCRIEMGRLSVELGLSISVRPVVFKEEGMIRVARMRGISCERRCVH